MPVGIRYGIRRQKSVDWRAERDARAARTLAKLKADQERKWGQR